MLAVLALVGLLLAPAAAPAAAGRCLHHGQAGIMDLSPSAGPASMPCCDEDGGSPSHDSKACAQDCAVMCVVPVALPGVSALPPQTSGHALLVASPPKTFRAHAPPGFERPPRSFI